ncbi:T6SS phospholipase effector Tle1-like catalytic domain-containing protein [Achromobacter marplatensis]|uniref:T6SS phospholipase effector Tle1-like catalytic domain-containing protein n=1 Tax=Achromobacter marplatensis TaxID=470868 RepID=UPI0039F68DC0
MTLKFRFANPCREIPSDLDFKEQRKACQRMGEKAGTDCSIELFFGFFFDGTRNNMYLSDKAGDHTQTNVARLYNVFDDTNDPSYSARQHRFRTYVEGVGTPCVDKVGDPGTGAHAQAGAAAGWGGEARINWALLEFQNHLYSHFTSRELFEDLGQDPRTLVREMSADMSLSRLQVEDLAKSAKIPLSAYSDMKPGDAAEVLARRTQGFVDTLLRVRQVNYTEPKDMARYTVLSRRNRELRERLSGYLTANPKIERIRVSIFGFSRGAAEARVFANWLKDACDVPEGMSFYNPRGDGVLRLAGIKVDIDFMGLFDTVASAGIAQSAAENIWDGHGAWARKPDMEIPSHVSRCVHMVGAHEVRGSFPLDLIDGAGCEEIVYPGVHSDVGGGYKPAEQGRGQNDSDKLSQIPLCDMYREAVQAGVPLRLHRAPTRFKVQFDVSPELRTAFNAYVEATRDISARQASTRQIMYGHYVQYLRWRRLRAERGPEWIGGIPSALRAKANYPQDYEDLVQANDELLLEVRKLTTDNALERTGMPSIMPGPGAEGARLYDSIMLMLRGTKEKMWLEQIRNVWNLPGRPAAGVVTLLDNFVHDSRAWFKPLGKDDDVWGEIQRDRVKQLEQREKQAAHYAATARPDLALVAGLNKEEREELARYRANPNDLALQSNGREFYWQWGYLRWRSIYVNPQVRAQKEAQKDQEDTIRALQNMPINFNALPRF